MILRVFRQVGVEVDDNGNGYDEHYREEVMPDELLDDIPVENLDVAAWIDYG